MDFVVINFVTVCSIYFSENRIVKVASVGHLMVAIFDFIEVFVFVNESENNIGVGIWDDVKVEEHIVNIMRDSLMRFLSNVPILSVDGGVFDFWSNIFRLRGTMGVVVSIIVEVIGCFMPIRVVVDFIDIDLLVENQSFILKDVDSVMEDVVLKVVHIDSFLDVFNRKIAAIIVDVFAVIGTLDVQDHFWQGLLDVNPSLVDDFIVIRVNKVIKLILSPIYMGIYNRAISSLLDCDDIDWFYFN